MVIQVTIMQKNMQPECHISSTDASDSPAKQFEGIGIPSTPAQAAPDPPSTLSVDGSSVISITATLKPRIVFDAKQFAPKRWPPSGVSNHSSRNQTFSTPSKSNFGAKRLTSQKKSAPKAALSENEKPAFEKVILKQEELGISTPSPCPRNLPKNSSVAMSFDSSAHLHEGVYIGSENDTSHSNVRNLPTVHSSEVDISKKISSINKLETSTSSHLNEESLTENSGPGTSHKISAKEKDTSLLATEKEFHNGWSNLSSKVEVKENVRALQGKDPALEHLDFAGERMPPPCDWEGGRPKFDNSFIDEYIAEWRAVSGPNPDPTGFEKSEEWRSGKFDVNDHSLVPAPNHQDSIPTPGETEAIELKRMNQTSIRAASSEINKNEKRAAKQRVSGRREPTNSPRIVHDLPEISPFSPKIEMYLRPVVIEDSEQIAQIYNKHIARGNITEDQEEISTEDAMRLVKKNKIEKLPFIVAVAGKVPKKVNAHAEKNRKPHDIITRSEKIIGFAFNERYRYGFSGSVEGRSRYTTNLQLFVDFEYQGKGVGRNLLDRLIHTLSTAYGYKKTCEFVNPESDKVYECEGSGMWHQIQFQVPVLKQDDPDFDRIKKFLFSHFLIKEICRMKSTGRTNFKNGPAKWMDTVIFQFETSQEGNFDPFS
ncbi:putative acyl- n-acyltransferase [Golovinomyces cichoracearum]|uniref:Putative acyl-n-acyltransferase n=1 Tax=Golovinomyces cichoracearum TaxID=62708 RepID=A0A420IF84_9PEZI|nr:putative acyl- n-acyltransferase [Golovinomyces cichoracearum]